MHHCPEVKIFAFELACVAYRLVWDVGDDDLVGRRYHLICLPPEVGAVTRGIDMGVTVWRA